MMPTIVWWAMYVYLRVSAADNPPPSPGPPPSLGPAAPPSPAPPSSPDPKPPSPAPPTSPAPLAFGSARSVNFNTAPLGKLVSASLESLGVDLFMPAADDAAMFDGWVIDCEAGWQGSNRINYTATGCKRALYYSITEGISTSFRPLFPRDPFWRLTLTYRKNNPIGGVGFRSSSSSINSDCEVFLDRTDPLVSIERPPATYNFTSTPKTVTLTPVDCQWPAGSAFEYFYFFTARSGAAYGSDTFEYLIDSFTIETGTAPSPPPPLPSPPPRTVPWPPSPEPPSPAPPSPVFPSTRSIRVDTLPLGELASTSLEALGIRLFTLSPFPEPPIWGEVVDCAAGWDQQGTAMTAAGCTKTLRFPGSYSTGKFAPLYVPGTFHSLSLTYRTTIPDVVLYLYDCEVWLKRTEPFVTTQQRPATFTYTTSTTVTLTPADCGRPAGSTFPFFDFYVNMDSDGSGVRELLIGEFVHHGNGHGSITLAPQPGTSQPGAAQQPRSQAAQPCAAHPAGTPGLWQHAQCGF
ncbi:hypothetical protein CHLRE_16g689851v5 [Chlamydomonas reinhardtii]|uniref:Uncharacterized protein n=1 Tax=Chlamydomonas reinhardtii TaxID=3055 RepID=A0A2K3CU67_CHLRE|nr:uncharacterized protein CHLRE_16g689851v5 [Chlamydomonas reinhardtii]PNW71826.1 hypothetical protein CHLRE_16g689851v5 [Chlamydomonas reinhardtii]